MYPNYINNNNMPNYTIPPHLQQRTRMPMYQPMQYPPCHPEGPKIHYYPSPLLGPNQWIHPMNDAANAMALAMGRLPPTRNYTYMKQPYSGEHFGQNIGGFPNYELNPNVDYTYRGPLQFPRFARLNSAGGKYSTSDGNLSMARPSRTIGTGPLVNGSQPTLDPLLYRFKPPVKEPKIDVTKFSSGDNTATYAANAANSATPTAGHPVPTDKPHTPAPADSPTTATSPSVTVQASTPPANCPPNLVNTVIFPASLSSPPSSLPETPTVMWDATTPDSCLRSHVNMSNAGNVPSGMGFNTGSVVCPLPSQPKPVCPLPSQPNPVCPLPIQPSLIPMLPPALTPTRMTDVLSPSARLNAIGRANMMANPSLWPQPLTQPPAVSCGSEAVTPVKLDTQTNPISPLGSMTNECGDSVAPAAVGKPAAIQSQTSAFGDVSSKINEQSPWKH